MKKILWHFSSAFLPILLSVAACGGGTSTTGGTTEDTTTASVSSLDQIPDISSMISRDTSSSGLSASSSKSLKKPLVSGTPPNLVDLSVENVDAYFWNGLIDQINSDAIDASDEDVREAFWKGEGGCRMAQNIGYSFQNIMQSGASLCYMKNAPEAEDGMTVTSGDVTAAEVFAQSSATKIVHVAITGFSEQGEGEGGGPQDQDIYIRVYGSGTTEGSSGFASDLWFCSEGEESPTGYEQIRINTSTGAITQTAYDTGFGEFVSVSQATLKEDTDGSIIFDPDQTREVSLFYSGTFGDFSNQFKGLVSVSGDQLTTKNWNAGQDSFGSYESQGYIVSEYEGNTMAELKFNQAAFNMSFGNGENSNTFDGSVEYQDSLYVAGGSDNELLSLVTDFAFSSDSFFSGDLEADSTVTSSLAGFSCSATVDVEVAMDMTATGMQAVQTLCENSFSEMNFCDGESISQARNAIFSAEIEQQP